MTTTFTRLTVSAATALALLSGAALAETLNWARSGDSLTLDPHAQNEGPTHSLAHQMYEPLIMRDMSAKQVPALATEWGPDANDPTVWNFKLREGVTFHNGNEFDSSDVVYSFNRAMSPDSDMKELLSSVESVMADGKYGFKIKTKGPNPILPANLGDIFIMDEEWTKANSDKVQDFEGGEDTFASRNAMGTGPYKLVSRSPGEKTVLEAYDGYWGKDQFPLHYKTINYTPIKNDATRVAALLSGEVDFVQDMPVQDLARVDADAALKVIKAPQNRVIFLGMNQGDADLKTDNVDGKNPLADQRVRMAMNMAIQREAIQKVVMRDQSIPAGVAMPPFVNGYTEALDAIPAADMDKAKGLMAEAGYADGFELRLNCPNDRYINDEAICQAVVGMMAPLGIKVNLEALPKAQHFPLIKNLETDFYMLGWGVPTYDSEYIFNFLMHTKGEDRGSWNGTRYSNTDMDAKIVSLASETDLAKRDATIGEIWAQVQEDVLYLPIHHQVLNWGMKDSVVTVVSPDDQAKIKWFEKK